jgi:hypothetical protein
VGPAFRIEVRRIRRRRRLPGGQELPRGELIGILHLDNDHVRGLHRGRPADVGLAMRRQVVVSLRALATLGAAGGPLAPVRAFQATTVFHRGLARLGFEAEPGEGLCLRLIGAYQRRLLASLHPRGPAALRRARARHARRLWLTRESLLARYGPRQRGAIDPPTGPSAHPAVFPV